MSWFGVRTVVAVPRHELPLYEERVTIWQADTADEAMELAEQESREYAETVEGEPLGLVQSYAFDGDPVHGAEVYSLMRASALPPAEYLGTHFDTGSERFT